MIDRKLSLEAVVMCVDCVWARVSCICVQEGMSPEIQNIRAERGKCEVAGVLGPNGTVEPQPMVLTNGVWDFKAPAPKPSP